MLLVVPDHPANEQVEFFIEEASAKGGHGVVGAVIFFVAGIGEELAQPTITAIVRECRAGSDFAEQLVFADWLQRVAVDAVRLEFTDRKFTGLEDLTPTLRSFIRDAGHHPAAHAEEDGSPAA